MRSFRRGLLLLLCIALPAGASLHAASRALIIVGLSTNDTQAARLLETAESIQTSLLRRGFAPASVLLHAPAPGQPLRRDRILAAFATLAAPPPPAAPPASSADETWIVLLGTAAPDRGGQPALQVTGPRFTASDLATALKSIPGGKSVVVATSASGGFLPPLLSLPDVQAVAATAETGQVNEPRFAAFWAEALAAEPSAPFATLAARAADRVAAYYGEQSLAQSETARRIDRTGAAARIVEAPFSAPGNAEPRLSPLPSPSAPRPVPSVDIAALQIPKPSGQTEIERRPADDESRALLAAAREAAKDSPYAALILRRELDLIVASDFSRRETWRLRAYLRTGEALDDFGSLQLGGDGAFSSARLLAARVIRPDATQLLLNPAARSSRLATEIEADRERDPSGSRPPPPGDSPGIIHFPELAAGCLVEAEWTLDHRADGTLPEFYDEWHFTQPYPQKSLRVTVSLPADTSRWRAFAPNLPAPGGLQPAASDLRLSDLGHPTASPLVWELADLPAHEALPGDAPHRTIAPWIGVSSVATWETFAAWYRRLAVGSDATGPEIDALAAEIATAHSDRSARLRSAYERVAALRYVAIELGVGAFRPRTPEQVWRQRYGDCKDKANLLVALLAKLGIPAEFALVNRFDATFTDFPGWQFNHALARVPAAPDAGQPHDLWLDTTDRLVPFGVVAPGDLGRQALVFSPGFATAAFHEITAAQEPPAEWREIFTRAAATDTWRVELAATGSAEVRLRRLLLDLGPEQRRARLSDLLDLPVTSVEATDAYDLSAPYRIVVHAVGLTPESRPLLPGLRAHLADSPRPRLWDEGREWKYIRTAPAGTRSQNLPARLP